MSTYPCLMCGKTYNHTDMVMLIANLPIMLCKSCYSHLDTCATCAHQECEFRTNPDPMPALVQRTAQRGGATVITQVPNPAREEKFCHTCFCWNKDESFCACSDDYCRNYKAFFEEG